MIQRYLAALTIVLLLGMVLSRVFMLRRQGIRAMNFGKLDKTDFLIPPVAFFYFYIVFAAAFGLPTFAHETLFASGVVAWLGVLCCLAGLAILLASLVSFGRSFRVGIDQEHPDKLVTTGIFAVTRNPIYVGFWFVLLGQFLIFPNPIPLIAVVAATWLFHRQVLREEDYLGRHYGQDFTAYRARVRRYL